MISHLVTIPPHSHVMPGPCMARVKFDYSNYRGRAKIPRCRYTDSSEVLLDVEDERLINEQVLPLVNERLFKHSVLEETRGLCNQVMEELYLRGYHRYLTQVLSIGLDPTTYSIQVSFYCLEAAEYGLDAIEGEMLNDADMLASLILHRDPPSDSSTQVYDGPPPECYDHTTLSITGVMEALSDWGRRPANNWKLRQYKHPSQAVNRDRFSFKTPSAIIVDSMSWQRLLDDRPEYAPHLNLSSGMGYIHGIPLFSVTQGSGYIPSGSCIVVFTDGPVTLRGTSRSVHQLLLRSDATIAHFYLYSRFQAIGFCGSRITIER